MIDDPGCLAFRSINPVTGWRYGDETSGPIPTVPSDPAPDLARASTCHSISLVKEGRLSRDCLERVLLGPGRLIDSSCGTMGALRASMKDGAPPDLVIVSPSSQGVTETFNELRELRKIYPSVRWIVVSPSMHVDILKFSVSCGIEGFLYDDSPLDVLRLVTDLVLLGHSLLPAGLATLIHMDTETTDRGGKKKASADPWLQTETNCNLSSGTGSERDAATHPPGSGVRPLMSLSLREDEILGCLAKGHSNKTIARELLIAEATVKAHVKALLRKMQVVNRTQAAIAAPRFLRCLDRPGEAVAVGQPLPTGLRAEQIIRPSFGSLRSSTLAAL